MYCSRLFVSLTLRSKILSTIKTAPPIFHSCTIQKAYYQSFILLIFKKIYALKLVNVGNRRLKFSGRDNYLFFPS